MPFLQVPYSCAIDELHACCLLSRFILPMRFYISRVLECCLCCQTLFFFLVQFFASLPIPPNISPVSCFFCSTCFFQPVLQWIKEGRTWYLIFITESSRANKAGKKVGKPQKKGRQRRRKEGNGWGGGKEGKYKSCSQVHHVL